LHREPNQPWIDAGLEAIGDLHQHR